MNNSNIYDRDNSNRSQQSQYDERRHFDETSNREDSSRDFRTNNRHKLSRDYNYSDERDRYDNSNETNLRRYGETHPDGYQDRQESNRSSQTRSELNGIDYGFGNDRGSYDDYRNRSDESYRNRNSDNLRTRYGNRENHSEYRSNSSESFDQGYRGKGPKGYKRSNEKIEDEVCQELMRSPQIDASDIEVSVKDGVVTLKGSVESKSVKRLAEDLCEEVLGVEDVQNTLRIVKNNTSSQRKTSNPTSRSSTNSNSNSKH